MDRHLSHVSSHRMRGLILASFELLVTAAMKQCQMPPLRRRLVVLAVAGGVVYFEVQ